MNQFNGTLLLKNTACKIPSWAGLTPRLPKKMTVNSAIASQLCQLLNMPGKVYQLCFGENVSSSYLIQSGNQEFYIKEILIEHLSTFQSIRKLTSWLSDRKINTYPYVNTYEDKSLGRAYLIYEYLQGRRLTMLYSDLKLLGNATATLHRVLEKHPGRKIWNMNTARKFQELDIIRDNLVKKKYDKLNLQGMALISELASQFSFDFFYECTIPLHGDLNPGNVLLSESQQVIFFDFEETFHSVQSVVSELAYVIERFILCRSTKNQALDLSLYFLKKYRQAGGEYAPSRYNKHALYYLSLKAFCTMLYGNEHGHQINQKEWGKFLFLLDKAEENKHIFGEIFK